MGLQWDKQPALLSAVFEPRIEGNSSTKVEIGPYNVSMNAINGGKMQWHCPFATVAGLERSRLARTVVRSVRPIGA
jgi:hypothetical protein